MQDLTSIDKVVSGLRQTQADGAGRSVDPKTEATGAEGQPTHGHGTGKIDLFDIVKPKDLLPPREADRLGKLIVRRLSAREPALDCRGAR